MTRNLALMLMLGAALAACSNTVTSLQYARAPGTPSAASSTPAAPGAATIGAITSIDKRKERPTLLATIMGGFGNPLKTLETSKPVKDEVADTFARGLRTRGLLAADGQAPPYALRLTVPEFDADMLIGRQARITVTLEVLDRAGAVIYADTVRDTESDMKFMQTGIFADINDLRVLCETVLARTVDTMLDKAAFRTAVAGDPNNPIRAAAAAPPSAPGAPARPPASTVPTGTDVRDVFTIGDVQIPLLEGTWTLAGLGPAASGRAASLVRIENGKLWGITFVWTGASARPALSTCGRTDVLFTAVTSNAQHGDQDCWTINHAVILESRGVQTEQHQRQAYEFLDARGVPLDGGLTLISSTHRVATPSGYVTVIYQVNPAFFGFEPSGASRWQASEWHRSRIEADPRRIAFVESFKAFNAHYQEHVRAGFRNQLGAFTPKPMTVADARLTRLARN